jgi:hypothetical protein
MPLDINVTETTQLSANRLKRSTTTVIGSIARLCAFGIAAVVLPAQSAMRDSTRILPSPTITVSTIPAYGGATGKTSDNNLKQLGLEPGNGNNLKQLGLETGNGNNLKQLGLEPGNGNNLKQLGLETGNGNNLKQLGLETGKNVIRTRFQRRSGKHPQLSAFVKEKIACNIDNRHAKRPGDGAGSAVARR